MDFCQHLISEASKPYEAKMLQLVGNDPARRCEIAGKLLSGIDKPDLLMYHVDVLHSEDGHSAYEFLIEFCTNDPSVGIYYGCRGFTNLIFSEFIHSKKSQLEDNAKLVPWRLIRSVFLDKNGNAFKDSIRTQWQYEGRTDAKTDFWRTKITSLL